MNNFELKENTHIVIKREDVMTLITADEAIVLANILQKIEDKRFEEGKKIRQSYYVVNHDEPYAQQVLDVIKSGEVKKKPRHIFDSDESRYNHLPNVSIQYKDSITDRGYIHNIYEDVYGNKFRIVQSSSVEPGVWIFGDHIVEGSSSMLLRKRDIKILCKELKRILKGNRQ